MVNVVGTSTCIMAIGEQAAAGPRRVRRGSRARSIPARTGIEAGLSATGDIFEAIARRAGTTVAALSEGLENYRAGETGLLRLTWDNGDRTVLVNPELSGITLGWRLTHTAQDELFAAIEGTAFHTRVILERMEQHGVPVRRVINGGGIPQKKPGAQPGVRQRAGQARPGAEGRRHQPGLGHFRVPGGRHIPHHRRSAGRALPRVSHGRAAADARWRPTRELYPLYRKLYFSFGERQSEPVEIGDILPELRRIAARARRGT